MTLSASLHIADSIASTYQNKQLNANSFRWLEYLNSALLRATNASHR